MQSESLESTEERAAVLLSSISEKTRRSSGAEEVVGMHCHLMTWVDLEQHSL